jgi:hypothetical protein
MSKHRTTPPAERELEDTNQEHEPDERGNRDHRDLETEKLESEHAISFLEIENYCLCQTTKLVSPSTG